MKKPAASSKKKSARIGRSQGKAIRFPLLTRKIHPLAELFPPMDAQDFAALCLSLKQSGFDPEDKIVLLDGQVLDGRNRQAACIKEKVRPLFRQFDRKREGDPLKFVLRRNLARRHLNESQRAMVAAKLAGWQRGDNQHSGVTQYSLGQAAELLRVSRRSTVAAKAVAEHGAAELRAAVEGGTVSVSTAAELAQLPEAQQAELVARGEKQILAAASDIRAKKNSARKAAKVARIIEINKGNGPLEFGGRKFVIAVADPPWRYERPLIGDCDRSIENKYPTLSIGEICTLPVHAVMAEQAGIFLHIPQPLQLCETPEGLCYPQQVGRAFGDPHWNDPDKCDRRKWFIPRAMGVWEKRSPADIAKDGGPLGMGHYFRTDHECLVFMSRGGLPVPDFKPRSVFHIRARGVLEHSEKPAEIYDAIRKMYAPYFAAGPQLALFERKARPGFVVWGNQAPGARGAGPIRATQDQAEAAA